MGKNIPRILNLHLPAGKSAFLWGPRKVGKTYWIKHQLRNAALIDLLKTDVFADYAAHPALLRERYQNNAPNHLIVIDEVQKVPALLDEVHWLIENKRLSFLLTGSSARKLRRGHANLLGGRAWRKIMVPLSYAETGAFDLERTMNTGLLPAHFLSPAPLEDLRAYVADYLKEEIAAEALVQNIPAFSEFLRVAAITSSELLNYANLARECGVGEKVIRNYFSILEDTYLGFTVEPWKKSQNRRLITTEKFYLFDVGVANYLARRTLRMGTPEFGKAFEHYILMELKAYQAYRFPELPIAYWRTSTGQEVDFILGDKEIALEIKASNKIHPHALRAFKTLQEDGPVKRCIVVSLEKESRILQNQVEILPWQLFLQQLWAGKII